MSSLTSEDSNMGNKQSSLSADSDSGAECRQISTDCLPEVIEPEATDPVRVVPPSRVKQEPCERRQTSESEDALQQSLEVNIDIHLTGSPEASVLSDAEDVQDDSVIVLAPARHRALRSSGHQEPKENSEEQAMREKHGCAVLPKVLVSPIQVSEEEMTQTAEDLYHFTHPFLCPETGCDKRYTSIASIIYHCARVHNRTLSEDEEMIISPACDVCGKRIRDVTTLHKHLSQCVCALEEEEAVKEAEVAESDEEDSESNDEDDGDTVYQCRVCDHVYIHPKNFRTHLVDVHHIQDVEEYMVPMRASEVIDLGPKCNICGASFTKWQRVYSHVNLCHGGYPDDLDRKALSDSIVYACESCKQTFKMRQALGKHCGAIHQRQASKKEMDGVAYKLVSDRGPTCDMCGKEFNKWSTWREHISICEDKHGQEFAFPCSSCKQVSNASHSLQRHVRDIHQRGLTKEEMRGTASWLVADRQPSCDKCGKMFTTWKSWRDHESNCQKNKLDEPLQRVFPCDSCKQVCMALYSVTNHARKIHHREPTENELNGTDARFVSHRQPVCDHCGQKFSLWSSWREHQISCSQPTDTTEVAKTGCYPPGKTLYPCPSCKMVLRAKFSLKKHMREIHAEVIDSNAEEMQGKPSGEVPIVEPICDLCGTLFARWEGWRNHVCRIAKKECDTSSVNVGVISNKCHPPGRTLYPCLQCKQVLSAPHLYISHMNTIHGMSPSEEALLGKPSETVPMTDPVCDDCGKSFQRWPALRNHICKAKGCAEEEGEFHAPGSTLYPCSMCKQVLMKHWGLTSHMRQIHQTEPTEIQLLGKPSEKVPISRPICDDCGREFSKWDSYRHHVCDGVEDQSKQSDVNEEQSNEGEAHEDQSNEGDTDSDDQDDQQLLYPCPHCKQVLKYPAYLTRHMATIHSKTPSLFDLKGRAASEVTVVDPTCDRCGKVFERWDGARLHQKQCTEEPERKSSMSDNRVRSPSQKHASLSEASSFAGNSATKPSSQSCQLPDKVKRNPITHAFKLECKPCSKVFEHRSSLYKHQKSMSCVGHRQSGQSRDLVYPCHLCGRVFNYSQSATKHLIAVHKTTAAENRILPRPASEVKHRNPICLHCSSSFDEWRDLYEHMDLEHKGVKLPTSEDQLFPCHICGKVLMTRHAASAHLSIHKTDMARNPIKPKLAYQIQPKKPSCNKCRKTFERWRQLYHHLRTEHKNDHKKETVAASKDVDMVYPCHLCGKVLKNMVEYHLKVVHKTTLKADPIVPVPASDCPSAEPCCIHCGLSFKDWKQVYKHLRQAHADKTKRNKTAKNKFTRCDECCIIFQNEEQLRRHSEISHPDKPLQVSRNDDYVYPCKICGRILSELNNLESHMKSIHQVKGADIVIEGVLRHEVKESAPCCKTCRKEFSTWASLYKHMKTQCSGGGKIQSPIKSDLFCQPCGISFRDHEELRKHQQHHGSKKRSQEHSDSAQIYKKQRVDQPAQKPITCILCDREFIAEDVWFSHLKSSHRMIDRRREEMRARLRAERGLSAVNDTDQPIVDSSSTTPGVMVKAEPEEEVDTSPHVFISNVTSSSFTADQQSSDSELLSNDSMDTDWEPDVDNNDRVSSESSADEVNPPSANKCGIRSRRLSSSSSSSSDEDVVPQHVDETNELQLLGAPEPNSTQKLDDDPFNYELIPKHASGSEAMLDFDSPPKPFDTEAELLCGVDTSILKPSTFTTELTSTAAAKKSAEQKDTNINSSFDSMSVSPPEAQQSNNDTSKQEKSHDGLNVEALQCEIQTGPKNKESRLNDNRDASSSTSVTSPKRSSPQISKSDILQKNFSLSKLKPAPLTSNQKSHKSDRPSQHKKAPVAVLKPFSGTLQTSSNSILGTSLQNTSVSSVNISHLTAPSSLAPPNIVQSIVPFLQPGASVLPLTVQHFPAMQNMIQLPGGVVPATMSAYPLNVGTLQQHPQQVRVPIAQATRLSSDDRALGEPVKITTLPVSNMPIIPSPQAEQTRTNANKLPCYPIFLVNWSDLIVPCLSENVENVIAYRRITLRLKDTSILWYFTHWFENWNDCTWRVVALLCHPVCFVDQMEKLLHWCISHKIPSLPYGPNKVPHIGSNNWDVQPLVTIVTSYDTPRFSTICCQCGVVVYQTEGIHIHANRHHAPCTNCHQPKAEGHSCQASSGGSAKVMFINMSTPSSKNKSPITLVWDSNQYKLLQRESNPPRQQPRVTTTPNNQEPSVAQIPSTAKPSTGIHDLAAASSDCEPAFIQTPKKASSPIAPAQRVPQTTDYQGGPQTTGSQALQQTTMSLTVPQTTKSQAVPQTTKSQAVLHTTNSQADLPTKSPSVPQTTAFESLASSSTSFPVTSSKQSLLKSSFKRVPSNSASVKETMPKIQTKAIDSLEMLQSALDAASVGVPLQSMDQAKVQKSKASMKKFIETMVSYAQMYYCTECRKKFPTKLEHEQHMTKEHKKCTLCKDYFDDRQTRSMHITAHHGQHICLGCDFTAPDDALIKSHILSEHVDITTGLFKCAYCKDKQIHPQSIVEHLEEHDKQEINKCVVCLDLLPQTMVSRFKHFFEHTLPASQSMCLECDRFFLEPWALIEHCLTYNHSVCVNCLMSPVQFSCSQCGPSSAVHPKVAKAAAAWINDGNLATSWNKCNVCFEELTHGKTLREHCEEKHASFKYQCDVCYQKFEFDHQLRFHSTRHKNRWSYMCYTACMSCFAVKSSKSNKKTQYNVVEKCDHCQPLPPAHSMLSDVHSDMVAADIAPVKFAVNGDVYTYKKGYKLHKEKAHVQGSGSTGEEAHKKPDPEKEQKDAANTDDEVTVIEDKPTASNDDIPDQPSTSVHKTSIEPSHDNIPADDGCVIEELDSDEDQGLQIDESHAESVSCDNNTKTSDLVSKTKFMYFTLTLSLCHP